MSFRIRITSRLRHPRLRGGLIVVVVLLLLLATARIAAPYLLKSIINDRLDRVPEYTGRVADVDLHLWRGACVLDGIRIDKQDSALTEPFFAAERADISIAWRDLFHGKVVSVIKLSRPRLTLVTAPTESESQVDADRRWQEVVADLVPIEIQHFEVTRGAIRFVDENQEPRVDIAIEQLELTATGLRNRKDETDEALPARVSARATTVGRGLLRLDASLAPLEYPPVFDIDCSVESVDLPALNDFLRGYANVDVSQGTLGIYCEVAGRDGEFEGYLKPFFENLDFENLSDRHRSLVGRVWESLVAAFSSVVKNPTRDQLGTRVPFEGSFAGTEVGTFGAMANAIRHGFIEAFSETIEGDLQPSDVRTDE